MLESTLVVLVLLVRQEFKYGVTNHLDYAKFTGSPSQVQLAIRMSQFPESRGGLRHAIKYVHALWLV